MRLRYLPVILFGFLVTTVLAQQSDPIFAWEQGDLALRYPAAWLEPAVTQDNQRWILTLTPTTEPESAADAMLIRLSFFGTGDSAPDLNDFLNDELRDLQLQPALPLSVDLYPGVATVMYGTGRNFSGKGWILALPESNAVLIMAGRTPVERQHEFETAFSLVTNSITRGSAAIPPVPGFGALWQTQSSFADGISAFLAPAGLGLTQTGSLILVDAFAGLVMFDTFSGSVTAYIPFPEAVQPSGIAIAPDNTVYVADLVCACIRRWQDNQWSVFSQGYGPGAPRSLALAADGTLYATDTGADGQVLVRSIQGTAETRLTLETASLSQPLLAVDQTGQILALAADGSVLHLNGTVFTPLIALQLNLSLIQFNAFTVDAAGNYVIATPRDGIVVIAPSGEEVSRPGQPALSIPPKPGEFVNPVGVAVAPDGTVYAVDAGGDFTSVIALSKLAAPGQIGAEKLRSSVIAQGTLDETRENQLWTFDAARGDILNLMVLSLQPGIFDVALCLYEPSGREIECVDNFEITPEMAQNPPEIMPLNPADPLLTGLRLNQDGTYFILVRRVRSFGSYQLGFSLRQNVELEADVPVMLYGSLSGAIPVQQYEFTARGGSEVTITMLSQGGTLDPTLILRNARGDVLMRNDNADDVTLGGNAQIAKFRLPSGGDYVIDAMSFSGGGRYALQIEMSPG